VYADGVSVRLGKQQTASRWDDVKAVGLADILLTSDIHRPLMFVLTRRSGHTALVLPWMLYQKAAPIRSIQELTLPYLLPEYAQALEAGERISFVDSLPPPRRENPPIHLTKDGIESGKRKLAWADLQKFSFNSSELRIVPKSGHGGT